MTKPLLVTVAVKKVAVAAERFMASAPEFAHSMYNKGVLSTAVGAKCG